MRQQRYLLPSLLPLPCLLKPASLLLLLLVTIIPTAVVALLETVKVGQARASAAKPGHQRPGPPRQPPTVPAQRHLQPWCHRCQVPQHLCSRLRPASLVNESAQVWQARQRGVHVVLTQRHPAGKVEARQ